MSQIDGLLDLISFFLNNFKTLAYKEGFWDLIFILVVVGLAFAGFQSGAKSIARFFKPVQPSFKEGPSAAKLSQGCAMGVLTILLIFILLILIARELASLL